MPKPWFVYIVQCRDGLYYTGITNNLKQRVKEHNTGKGALFTSKRLPVKLIYFEQIDDQLLARKREVQIKDWRRAKKEWLASRLRSK